MNKKQMLKEQKRLKRERKESEKMFRSDDGMSDFLKITIGVILFIGITFAFINISNGNWNLFNKKNRNITEIDSKMLIVGTMFNKEDEEYLVLAYDMSTMDADIYNYLSKNYYDSPNLYLIDLSSGFNQDFIAENTNISNDLDSLKFGGPTLLLINKDKITASYTTEEQIISYFSSK